MRVTVLQVRSEVVAVVIGARAAYQAGEKAHPCAARRLAKTALFTSLLHCAHMQAEPDKLLERHQQLVHSQLRKVNSHVQRESGEWIINTLLTEGCEVPFRYKRKRMYRSLAGALVNLTYYPATDAVAGIEIEIMNVVRIRRA
jgi:hypothetical protein